MAWLKGLAGKAEDILNQIDQNAAQAFQNDRKDNKYKGSNWENPSQSFTDSSHCNYSTPTIINMNNTIPNANLDFKINLNNDITNSPKTPKREKKVDNEEHLIEFLNSPSKFPSPNSGQEILDSDSSSSLVEHEPLIITQEEVFGDAYTLKQELDDVKNELISIQKENTELNQEKLNLQSQQVEDFNADSKWQLEIQLKSTEERLNESHLECSQLRHTIEEANSRIRELVTQEKRSRDEVLQSREELSNYRVKAQRILQDKEKVIARLQENTNSDIQSLALSSKFDIEHDSWKREKELLVEEVQQLSHQLQAARDVAHQSELSLSEVREQASRAQRLASERLTDEIRRRNVAEDESRSLLTELRALREQLLTERTASEARAHEYETEISRVRTQKWHKDSELEARLDALTNTLMQKHVALETATTERNALRLAQEKQREAAALFDQSSLRGNDTDDAKALVPSFFAESPFDTNMTRRVKRAYSTLDAAGVRTGVFLRRYPLARILVICYMVLMHLWAFLLLMSSTPEPRCPNANE